MKRLTPWAAVLGAAVLAAGCGGGGGQVAVDTPPPFPSVPTSATESVAALLQWAVARPADDAADPLRLEGVALPASDTAEPAALPR